MTDEEKEFFSGAFLMLAEVYRAHGCSVTVKDCIGIIPDVENNAKLFAEYDVRSLRQVIKTLPMGCDANYGSFDIEDCGLFHKVYATEGNERYFIAEFLDYLEAHVMVNEWKNQLKENQSRAAK